jgi:hypothetical protein
MTATQVDTHPGGRQRAIGPLGTTARVLIGGLLLTSVTWGHVTRGSTPPPGCSACWASRPCC